MNRPTRFSDRLSVADREAEVATLDLGQIFRALWRGKWLIAAVFGGVLVVAALWIQAMTPIYRAAAEVMLDPRTSKALAIDSVVSELPANDAVVASEIGVITSRRVLNRVIAELSLTEDSEFNPRLRSPYEGLTDQIAGWLPESLAGSMRETFGAPENEEIAAMRPVTEERAVYNELLKKLSVRQRGISYIIEIRASSKSPRRAAEVANAVARAYVDNQLEVKFDATRAASNWLGERVESLRREVEEKEEAVEAARAAQVGENGSGAQVTEQQLSQLNTQLVSAQAERAAARANLEEIERLVAQSGYSGISGILTNDMIGRLRADLADLKAQRAELSQRYMAKHPTMIDIANRIGEIQSAIDREARQYVDGLRRDVAVAEAREKTLYDRLQSIEGRSLELAASSVSLRQLEREAQASRFLYENFLSRLKETSEQIGFQDADVRIISEAEPPGVAAEPRKRRLLALAMLAGLALGALAALGLDYLRPGVRSATELEAVTGKRTLGAIPTAGGLRGLGFAGPIRSLLREVRRRPEGRFAEAARSLAVKLWRPGAEGAPRTLLVTSSRSGEGKSSTALLLAHMAARLGHTAIVVECDLRRPDLHRALSIRASAGLADVIYGDAALADVLIKDEETGVWALPAGKADAGEPDGLYGTGFREVLDNLRQVFDVVILDSPPMHAVADAEILSAYVDAVLYLVAWARTPAEEAAAGVAQLEEAGARIVGTALTRVNPNDAPLYGYPRSGYPRAKRAA